MENVAELIASFVLPSNLPVGAKIMPVPKKPDSPLYAAGVRVCIGNDHYMGYFFCLYVGCRSRIEIKKSTSNAVYHLREKHGLTGARSLIIQKRKTAENNARDKRAKVLSLMDTARFYQLKYAIFTIASLAPLCWIELQEMRDVLCGIPDFPVTSSKVLKRLIVELYDASKTNIRNAMCRVKDSVYGSPIFHVSLDLWTSKSSKEKYVGIRVHYVDAVTTTDLICLLSSSLNRHTNFWFQLDYLMCCFFG